MTTDHDHLRDALSPLRELHPTEEAVDRALQAADRRADVPVTPARPRRPRLVRVIAGAAALSAVAAVGSVLVLGPSPEARAGSPLTAFSALAGTAPVASSASDIRPALDHMAEAQPEILGENARIVHTSNSGRVILFGANNGDICLAVVSQAAGAQSTCEARKRAGEAGVYFGGPVLRFGVVPDGVKTVRFTLTSGADQVVNTADNFFVAPDEAVRGTFRLAGAWHVREFVPRSDAPAPGESVTDERGVTTRVEPDGSGSVAGPGARTPD